jgi:hypothetical protein
MGRRSQGWSSTSIFGDVAIYLDTSQQKINAVSTGTTYYIVSSSASDAAAGVGARTVRVTYLDTNGVQNSATYTLNGTTAVSMGSGFMYFQWMEVASVGSSQEAVGNISVGSINGAQTVASTVEYIVSGSNRSMSGRYMVPAGYKAYINDWFASAISAAMDVRLRAKVFADDRTLSTVHHFQDSSYLASGQVSDTRVHYLECPPLCEIKISAVPASAPAGNRLDTSFHMLLLEQ